MQDESPPGGCPSNTERVDDPELLGLAAYLREPARIKIIGESIRDAIDYVLDGVTTGRVDITSSNVDKVEKTFLGLKVEQLIRIRMGLDHGDVFDVKWNTPDRPEPIEFDIKWSIRRSYTIPVEAVRERAICMLVSACEREATFEVGLIRATPEVLNRGVNQDRKRTLKAAKRDEVTHWLASGENLPENVLLRLRYENPELFTKLMGLEPGQARLDLFASSVQNRLFTNATLETLTGQRDNQRRTRLDNRRPATLRYKVIKPNSPAGDIPTGVAKPPEGYMLIVSR